MKIKLFMVPLMCAFLTINGGGYAKTSEILQTDSQKNEQLFDIWKENFRQEALKSGIDSDFLARILPQMDLLPSVVQSDRKQPEFQLTFWDYTERALTDTRLKEGRFLMKKHADLLKKSAQKYGVPAKYIVAFWGLETAYGSYKGNVDTLNALTTLAYDARRRKFFTKELIAFLKIMQQEKLAHIKGSWAGAFGNFQFMPTTFAAYGVDGDQDGQKDIVNSLPDAIETAANYLSKIGWDDSVKWGREVKIVKELNWDKVYEQKYYPIRQWEEWGILPANGMDWPSSFEPVMARLVMPMGVNGPVFLVYKNYDVIMQWNRSDLYALSVGLLSDALIMGEYQIYAPRKNTKFSHEQAKEIQELLTKMGYYNGAIDGSLGKGTRQAIRMYQKDNKLPQDGYATIKLLNKMKGI